MRKYRKTSDIKIQTIVDMTAMGYSSRKIAEKLLVSNTTVDRIRKAHKEEISQLRDQYTAEARQSMKAMSTIAAEALIETLTSNDPRLRLDASKFVLGQLGEGATGGNLLDRLRDLMNESQATA